MEKDDAEILFAGFRLVPAQRKLTRDGVPVALGARAMDILIHLSANAGKVVDKQALMSAVWPGRVVEENNLTVNMTALRKALGAGPDGDAFIKTVTGRGYMFVGAAATSGRSDPVESVAFPALASLPPSPARLIGRDRAVAELQALMRERRVVSIVGPGGVGKTALALTVAGLVASNFAHGVAFADLSTVGDAERVPEAIAAALSVGGAGANTATARLTALLRERQILLVLDNCERVVEPVAALVNVIVADCPGVVVLVTSREGLFVANEQIFRLPPLSIADAVDLFVERARSHGPFEMDGATAAPVETICTRLDGIPLAIEMAVPRLRLLSPAQLAERLIERFRLLGAAERGATSRHRTLQAVIDWSYDFLPASEQTLLQVLSVFSGGAGLEAIESVAGEADEVALLDRLTALADKSMVLVDADSEPRVRLLETIRQYAERKAADAGATTLPRRHASYYADRCAGALRTWPITRGGAWIETYAPDAENLRAALGWAFGEQGDGDLGVRLVASTVPLWWELPETPVGEGQRWLAAAAARLTPQTPPALRGWVRFGQSWRDFRFSDRENAPAALEAAELFREASEPAGLGAALWRAGSATLTRETLDQAEAYLVEGETVLRGIEPGKWLALVLIRLGDLRFRQGNRVQALSAFQEGFDLSRATDFWIGLVNGGSNMAELMFDLGERDRALTQLQTLRDELPVGRRTPLMTTLVSHLLVAGDFSAMRVAADEVIGQGTAIGLTSAVAWTVEGAALLAARAGELQEAARLAGYTRTVHPSLGTRSGSQRAIVDDLYGILNAGLSKETLEAGLSEGNRWTLAMAAARARTVISNI